MHHSAGFLGRAARLLGLSAPTAGAGSAAGGCSICCGLTLRCPVSASLPAPLRALLLGCPMLLLTSDAGMGRALLSAEARAPPPPPLLLLRQKSASRPLQAPTASAAPSGLDARLVTRWPKAHA